MVNGSLLLIGDAHSGCAPAVEQFLRHAPDTVRQRTAEESLASAADTPAPEVVVLLPRAGADALALARRIHRRWPQAHLLLAALPGQTDALRQALGAAPLLGRQWAIVELVPGRLEEAVQQARAAARQRQQLRTTLAAANATVSQTRTVQAAEYQRLVVADHHLAHFLRFAQASVIGLDPADRVLFISQGAERMLHCQASAVLGLRVQQLPLWTAALAGAFEQVRAGTPSVLIEEDTVVAGAQRTLELQLAAVPADAGGGLSMLLQDVTERRQAQDRLLASKRTLEELVAERTLELDRSQQALAQAQKLEALGKLTGGVAHDFNNVLQIIGSNLHLLNAALPADERAVRFVRAASSAVDRGARLSAQLLAFARRQPLAPQPLNINRRVAGMDDLLQRALGEAIRIETSLAAGLWTTLVDAHQLENVILNLAINARDAMPQGGRLTIETGNATLDETYTHDLIDVPPGQYVMVAVSDTGTGMPPEVQAQAFEPFFTTKPEGEGTGLGLSMAYGFAKQSGGHIRIYSEPGSGTTIRLYLPRSLEREVIVQATAPAPVTGGSETILVVEDDPAVQSAVAQMLGALGYKVLRAGDAQAGLAVLESGVQVDLLFTDVVMPGPLRSPELARRARLLQPGIAVLFTSGYTQNAIVHGGRLDAGVELLSKPYRQEDLARKVRQLLAARPRAGGPLASPPPAPPPAPSPSPPPQVQVQAPAAAPAQDDDGKPPRVLLVEDERDAREVLHEMIGMLGCEVASRGSAEEAELLLRKEAFDVLLTDLTLPGRSGAQLAELAVKLQPALRVIFASGYGPERTQVKGLRSWNLPKPFGMEELEKTLREALQGRRKFPAEAPSGL